MYLDPNTIDVEATGAYALQIPRGAFAERMRRIEELRRTYGVTQTVSRVIS
jgi:hypothetical protein